MNASGRRPLVPVVIAAALVAAGAAGFVVGRPRRPSVHEVAEPAEAPDEAAAPVRRRALPRIAAAAIPAPSESAPPAPVSTLPDPGADPVPGARAALDGILAELKGSGDARGDWLPKAQAAVQALRATPALADLVHVQSVRCFGGGCALEFSAGDADKARAAVAQIDKDETFRSWPGAKYRVGPLPAGPGRFRADVIFLRPE